MPSVYGNMCAEHILRRNRKVSGGGSSAVSGVLRCPGTIVGNPGRQSHSLSRQYGTFDAILRSKWVSALMIMFVSVFTVQTFVWGKRENEKSR